MNSAQKKNALKWNTILWLIAMAMPAVCHIALASTRFPWPLMFPLLLFGPMLCSNRMVSAAGEKD